MTLYHGSNLEIQSPKLLKNQRPLDFGRGFYTTSSLEQAEKWAKRTTFIRKSGEAVVSCYSLDEGSMGGLKILHFLRPDSVWLDYVAKNRKDIHSTDSYDLVIGPVANDQTFPTILLYLDGYIDAESAVRQLLPQKLKDQYTFKTEKALSLLKFEKAIKA